VETVKVVEDANMYLAKMSNCKTDQPVAGIFLKKMYWVAIQEVRIFFKNCEAD
jgi:hypothetical protein